MERGSARSRTCPKCEGEVRTYEGSNIWDLEAILVEAEASATGANAAALRGQLAGAVKRFHVRQDDWAAAESIAAEIAGKAPAGRELVAHVYRSIRAKGRPRHARKQRKAKAAKPKKPARATLESLDAERREEERKRVAKLKRGPVKKRLL